MHAIITTDITQAQQLLEKGEVVAIPTETVYGLAANALNESAVARIFETKNRPFFDPLIVHVADIEGARKLVTHFPEKAELLARTFWPGPLTLVLPRSGVIPDLVTSGLDTVGIRMPDHSLTLSLLKLLPFPLAAPSANPFGYISPTEAMHVMHQLGEKIPCILDGGPCHVGLESTIVDCSGERPIILRMGGIPVEAIEALIGPVEVKTVSTSSPHAPGMLLAHYAPRIPVVLGDPFTKEPQFFQNKTAVLSFCKPVNCFANRILSESGDLTEAARNLFRYMRELDASGASNILAELVPEEGLGRAINDKLRRAAHSEQRN